MASTGIDHFIINSPWEEPTEHWDYDREQRRFLRKQGRRSAGYVIATPGSKAFDDPGRFVQIELVNQVRPRIRQWRESEYPGVTGITKRLLTHWTNAEEHNDRPFFFCQLEAIETLIWLTEASAADRVGIEIPSDGGEFQRLCAKMATGTGKTVVMAMLIAWQVLNKVASPGDRRFARHVLVVAPGLTVKNRLDVLEPTHEENYYTAFRIVPSPMLDKLRQGKIVIHNWHALNWESEEKVAAKRSVDKRGAMSDEAYVREVLGELASATNILVINDEAHHAWRVPTGSKDRKGIAQADIQEATKWIGGLDRIHRARGILTCYDFSATPFTPSGKSSSEEALFGWIVSDFGLNDAIESGLVKTPRVVIRDDVIPDAETYTSRLYHIYDDDEVKDDLNRRAEPEVPLPGLVMQGYQLLGADWLETAKDWKKRRHDGLPPVMITVANRTETAARVKHAFDHKRFLIKELCAPERTLHIDTKALEQAEAVEESPTVDVDREGAADAAGRTLTKKLTKQQQAESLRKQVNTVGQPGKPGAQIQNVISVGMLSEGWDAKTVTHIMGLRAFTSQLLCEQVVGRGLRRTCYDVNPESEMFDQEYVNIFGVPFTFLPHEDTQNGPPPPPPPQTAIGPVADKAEFAISWPNIVRIDYDYRPCLSLEQQRLPPLKLDAAATRTIAELAPTVEGKQDLTRIKEIDLEKLAGEYRMQRIIFETAARMYDQVQRDWQGSRMVLIAQLVRLVEQFIHAGRLRVIPASFNDNDRKRRLTIALNMDKVVGHIREAIRFSNTHSWTPVFDRDHPLSQTGDMMTWYTSRPCEPTRRSHINFCVYDSTWEASEAFVLDRASEVAAWVKNDHLGFEVLYIYGGVVRKYRPDFLVRLKSGAMLVLETKGRDSEQDQVKRKFLDEWVQAVNAHGGFGHWSSAVSKKPGDVSDILARHLRKAAA